MVRGYSETSVRDKTIDRTPSTKAPSAAEVQAMHRNSDVDARREAQHHTLGKGSAQASPGDHNHRDGLSLPILEGIALTGSKSGTNSVLLGSLVAALVQLGATDNTT